MTTEPEPFSPELGEVGSWTELPDGSVGQVWALGPTGRKVTVWVADGQRYVQLSKADLKAPGADLDQLELI